MARRRSSLWPLSWRGSAHTPLSLVFLGSALLAPSRGQGISPSALATPGCALCPLGFTLISSTNKCLQVVTGGSWTQSAAITACAALVPGGTLWTIDSVAEFTFAQAPMTGTQEIWTGLFKTSCTPNLAASLSSPNCAGTCNTAASGRFCAWQWVDGSPFGSPLNAPATADALWTTADPNQAPPSCVRLSGGQGKLLADTGCATSFNSYACEVPPSTFAGRSCSAAPSSSPARSASRTASVTRTASGQPSSAAVSSSAAPSRSASPTASPCPGGFFCAPPGGAAVQCPGGWWCPVGSTTWNVFACGRGNYCPAGSAAPTTCGAPGVVDATLGPANGPAFYVDTAACRNHCYFGAAGQLSTCAG